MTPELAHSAEQRLQMAAEFWGEQPAMGDYWEDFCRGSRGWIANSQSQLALGKRGAICRGPWIVDANHAPPGAGYLHLLMHIHTQEKHLQAPYAKAIDMYSEDFLRRKQHAFIHQGHSRNFTNAKIRVALRGNLEARGARLSVLVQGQATPDGPRGNWILTGQHYEVRDALSHQEVTLVPDPAQWTFLGSRHDLSDMYGFVSVEEVLADVNVSFIFVLFPLQIVPVSPQEDKDRAWAGRDYKVRQSFLPRGIVEFQSVWFRYLPAV